MPQLLIAICLLFGTSAPAEEGVSARSASELVFTVRAVEGESFDLARVHHAYPRGWRATVGAEGYTATDDLWTLLDRSPRRGRCTRVRLRFENAREFYPDEHTCAKDVATRAGRLGAPYELRLE